MNSFNQPRTLLFAFVNGSYKKIHSVGYDHKEWIVVTKADGTKSFINSANVKWIDEVYEGPSPDELAKKQNYQMESLMKEKLRYMNELDKATPKL